MRSSYRTMANSVLEPDQIALVKQTFARVAPDPEAFATSFYTRLFELDPSLRAMFGGDLDEQGRKLMAMLATAVNGLDSFETIIPVLRALGARHLTYGVRPENYPTLGAALLSTLDEHLGDGFSDDAREAWADAYELLAVTMQSSTDAAR